MRIRLPRLGCLGSLIVVPLILALGKDRKAYLLDRNNLGGIGGQLAVDTVSERSIITAPVTYPAADGIFVALQGEGLNCPTQARGLLTLKIRPGFPSAITTAWCGSVRGRGAPIVTTTDGHSNPIRVGSWRRRRQSASRVQRGHWRDALHRASSSHGGFTSLPDADCDRGPAVRCCGWKGLCFWVLKQTESPRTGNPHRVISPPAAVILDDHPRYSCACSDERPLLNVRHDERTNGAVIVPVPDAHMAMVILAGLDLLTPEQVSCRNVEPAGNCLQ